MTVFHTQGPVPLDAPTYVERQFELALKSELLANRWVLLLGPRQHGKTSALLRTKADLVSAGVLCATVDLQALPPCERYSQILEWVARRLASQLGTALAFPEDRDDLFAWITAVLPEGAAPVALFFDEASSIGSDEFRNAFFGQLRSIANARTESPVAMRIRCLFAGTFRPETLVDERNSPFNVCQRIETDDFSLEQTRRVAISGANEDLGDFVDEVYRNVSGQPYLTQRLFQEIAMVDAAVRPEALATGLDRLINGDDPHCERLFSRIFEDERLIQIIVDLVSAGTVQNQPANADFRYLQVLGIVRRSGSSVVFRSDLYRKVASASPQIRLPQVGRIGNGGLVTRGRARLVLFELPRSAFDFMRSPELRDVVFGTHRGAIRAYNDGAFRLSLAGFGCALEGVLLDWMRAAVPADIARATQQTRATHNWQGSEVTADPSTWRLVTMIAVARRLSTKFRPVEPPDSVREWRNLIHPAKVLTHFIADEDLEPEARAASGLFEALRRDLAAELA